MTQIVLNVEDTSLIPSLKQILGAIKGITIDKLVTSHSDVESEKAFINFKSNSKRILKVIPNDHLTS